MVFGKFFNCSCVDRVNHIVSANESLLGGCHGGIADTCVFILCETRRVKQVPLHVAFSQSVFAHDCGSSLDFGHFHDFLQGLFLALPDKLELLLGSLGLQRVVCTALLLEVLEEVFFVRIAPLGLHLLLQLLLAIHIARKYIFFLNVLFYVGD